jgi:hypothetical protein
MPLWVSGVKVRQAATSLRTSEQPPSGSNRDASDASIRFIAVAVQWTQFGPTSRDYNVTTNPGESSRLLGKVENVCAGRSQNR